MEEDQPQPYLVRDGGKHDARVRPGKIPCLCHSSQRQGILLPNNGMHYCASNPAACALREASDSSQVAGEFALSPREADERADC